MRARVLLLACAIVASAVSASPRAFAETETEEPTTPAATPPLSPSPGMTAPPASQGDKPIVVWPTLTPAGDEVGATALHKPAPGEGAIHARAMELDATLRDAVQDLGYSLDIADPGPAMGHARDLDMVERA